MSVGSSGEQHGDIEQRFYLADHVTHKEQMLAKVITEKTYRQIIIFTATRADTERLSVLLNQQGMHSVALSGDLSQSQRSNIMNEFSRGQQHILVTTDIASRGLDLRNVSLVINFDLPKLADEYVHRVGRTGRAGDKGEAVSFVGPKDWLSFVAIKDFLKQSIEFSELEGLAAKFTGPKPARTKTVLNKDKAQGKTKGAETGVAAKPPKKRVNTMQGTDAGNTPLKRKPRASFIDTEQDEEE